MNKGIWSLALFTLLIQMSVGAILLNRLLNLVPKIPVENNFDLKVTLSVTICLILGVVLSFFHLGHPQNSLFALRNLGQSWLSREVLSLILLLVLTGIGLLLLLVRSEWYMVLRSIQWIAVLVGLLLVFSMTRIYMIETVPSWNNLFTPVAFFGSMILLGMVLVLFFSQITGKMAEEMLVLNRPLILAIALILLIDLICLFLSSTGISSPLNRIRLLMIVVLLCMLLIGYFIMGESAPVRGRKMLIILSLMLIIGEEIIGRLQFFAGYERIGV
jgi:anaerobic dimethyl sulfoxide reductase subunit C (anchor subunit)